MCRSQPLQNLSPNLFKLEFIKRGISSSFPIAHPLSSPFPSLIVKQLPLRPPLSFFFKPFKSTRVAFFCASAGWDFQICCCQHEPDHTLKLISVQSGKEKTPSLVWGFKPLFSAVEGQRGKLSWWSQKETKRRESKTTQLYPEFTVML